MRMKFYLLLTIFLIIAAASFAKIFHVAVNGSDNNTGSATRPFRTINHAAQLARPGDVIIVHAGTYREWINPKHGGFNNRTRIIYRAAHNEKVKIKGSEIISGWRREKSGVWKVIIPNTFFGNYNACSDLVQGHWCNNFGKSHTADIFLNGQSLYETDKLENVSNLLPYTKAKDKEDSTYKWYCEVDSMNTTIWANFKNYNPNKEVVELSTRKTCFYPDKPNINFITISGFDISQAATQWAAPTAEQIGMISTHWNKGWIIENNIIHDSKCSGITLGKERGTGHNVWLNDTSYDGSIHYIEVVFKTLRNGWNKKNIGSHMIRNNEIFNCEQTGICGSMGAAFSIIKHNHIFNIHQKNQFAGAEIAGIKFHAAIDTKVENNRIHDVAGYGCWFDWMAQGTRISKNLMYRNDRQDLFFEVNHGPFLVDNNILLSNKGIVTQSEGGAFVHNLFAGQITIWADPYRFTPYHVPHTTDVAGLAIVLAGDDRYYNNIFIGSGKTVNSEDSAKYGLSAFGRAIGLPAWEGTRPNTMKKLPVWINNNIYYRGAIPYDKEANFFKNANFDPGTKIIEEKNSVYLDFSVDDSLINQKTQFITTSLLGKVKMAKQAFENTDGTSLTIDTDFLNNKRSSENPSAGPFENPASHMARIKVW